MHQTNIHDFLEDKQSADQQRLHENQSENPIQRIIDWNKAAGLLDKPYDDFLESSFQIEEALEGFDIKELSSSVSDYRFTTDSPKEFARYIVKDETFTGTDVDRLDKACDAIVFAFGSMLKLGLNSEQITEALNIVMDSNMAKLGCPKDEHGKLTKPANFPNPEPRLQQLLDRRAK